MKIEELKGEKNGLKKYRVLNNPEKEDIMSSSSSLSQVDETSFKGLN
jgi:hypothetical protein